MHDAVKQIVEDKRRFIFKDAIKPATLGGEQLTQMSLLLCASKIVNIFETG